MKKFTLFAILIALFCYQGIVAQTLLTSYTKTNIIGTSQFGKIVTNVGDINNDGYDDIAVATSIINTNRGRVYIYLGGTDSSAEPYLILDGEERGGYFGISVSAAGDFNGDGYDDFIVGSKSVYEKKGSVYIYFGSGKPDNIADVVIRGEIPLNYFGISISGIGDFNKDGYSDIAVSEGKNGGDVFIYYGGEKPDAIFDLKIAGIVSGSNGCAISSAGDFNNDGYDDLIIGSSRIVSGGKASIFYGSDTPDVVADIEITGEGAVYSLGHSVTGGGDFNGDGVDDVIIGVIGYNSSKGAVYVLYGSDTPNNVKDIVIEEEEAIMNFGYSLDFAGDVNKDGIDDILVGGNNIEGSAYLYYGSATPQTDYDVKFTGSDDRNYFGISVSAAGDVDNDGYADMIIGSYLEAKIGKAYIYKGASTVDNTEDITYTGETTNNSFGRVVSFIGDINGDGTEDYAISANHNSKGVVYVYLGADNPTEAFSISSDDNTALGISVSGVGDINKDGYDDFIVGTQSNKAFLFLGSATPDNIADRELAGDGGTVHDSFGLSVSEAGDMNNDGYDDFIIGAYKSNGFNNMINGVGKAYIYFGGDDINNLNTLILEGEARQDFFGVVVSGAGDMNGDGYDDVIVGSWLTDGYKGKAYVFYGGDVVNDEPDIVYLAENRGFAIYLSEAGDVNGDGYDDVMISEIGSHNSLRGSVYIYYGGATADNVADVTIDGIHDKGKTGEGISALGDINGDGYDDIVVGTPYTPDTKGVASIYYGAENMDAVADVEIVGDDKDYDLGMRVDGGIDINGDGSPEMLVSAPAFNSLNGKVFLYTFRSKQDQTITFNKINLKAITDKTFTLDAVSSSGLPIEYTSSNTNVATISGNTVTIVGLGKTIITAKQIGNDSYNAAVEVSQELIIAKETQKINFTLSIDIEFGAESFDLEATSSSGLPITYTSSNTNVIAISGVRVTVVGAGETIITARQEGNDLYESSVAEQRVVVDKSDQTITFNELGGKTIGDEPFDLSATASSGLDIQYSSSDEKVATISGNTVTIVGTGITTITASQAGDNNYNAAADIQQALTIFSTSSIKDAESAGIKLYPNPVSDIVNIESENYIDVIQILNVESRLLRTVEVKGFNKSIDISDLNRGVYFIKIKSENNYYVIRVVKR